MRSQLSPILFACSLLLLSSARADFQVTYNFSGGSGTGSKSGVDAAAVTAGTFTPMGGNAALSSFSNMAFLRSSFTGMTVADALADTDYFSVTLSAANPGEFLDLNSFTLDLGGSSSDGNFISHLVVQSSVGGFGTGNPTLSVTPSSKFIFSGASGNYQLSGAIVDVSSVAFDSLSTVTFQFSHFDTNPTATAGVSSTNQINRFDDVVFGGSIVAPIPEASSVIMVLSAFVAFYFLAIRRC